MRHTDVLAHQGLFVAVIFCYLINFIGDVANAWALYFLLLPTNTPFTAPVLLEDRRRHQTSC
jgi:hypothetical protein